MRRIRIGAENEISASAETAIVQIDDDLGQRVKLLEQAHPVANSGDSQSILGDGIFDDPVEVDMIAAFTEKSAVFCKSARDVVRRLRIEEIEAVASEFEVGRQRFEKLRPIGRDERRAILFLQFLDVSPVRFGAHP